MSKIVPFEGTTNLPAHIAAMAQANDDLTGGVGSGGFPVISYKGKVWHIAHGDNRELVTNADGDPAASLEVIIVKGNPHLSKVYYADGYVEGSEAKPTCYSNNGVGPAADAVDRQSDTCATCPLNAWGSRVSENGSKGKACSDSRRLAVVPVGDVEQPMLLRVPAGTLKELAEYAKMLNRRQVGYQAVVTKVAFDHTVAHQKFTFKAVRFVTPEEAETVRELGEGEVVQQILGLAPMPHKAPEDGLGETPEHLKPKAVSKPKARHEVSESEIAEAVAIAKPKPKKVEPVAEAPAPSKKVDRAAALAEATASLDDVLGALDD